MKFWHKLAITAVCWCLWELSCVAQVKAIAANSLTVAASVSLTVPFIVFFTNVWWVEEKDKLPRLKLTAAGAIGAAIGTSVVMLLWG